jgi:hypothetical protein
MKVEYGTNNSGVDQIRQDQQLCKGLTAYKGC